MNNRRVLLRLVKSNSIKSEAFSVKEYSWSQEVHYWNKLEALSYPYRALSCYTTHAVH
jgi:hypothetical protein